MIMLSSLDILYLSLAGSALLLAVIGLFVGIQLIIALKKLSRLSESLEDTMDTMNMYVKLPAGVVVRFIDWLNSRGED